jgi:hypothetical protein
MQQRNTVVSLVVFLLILSFFSLRVFQMVQTATFIAPNVFRLWGIVVAAVILMVIGGSILAQIVFSIIHTIRTKEEPREPEMMVDERDKLIELKGMEVTYRVHSLGAFFAMLTFVLNHPPLVMFTLLIAMGLIAQIAGDVYRLIRYHSGV